MIIPNGRAKKFMGWVGATCQMLMCVLDIKMIANNCWLWYIMNNYDYYIIVDSWFLIRLLIDDVKKVV
jgi:hypothetical protein